MVDDARLTTPLLPHLPAPLPPATGVRRLEVTTATISLLDTSTADVLWKPLMLGHYREHPAIREAGGLNVARTGLSVHLEDGDYPVSAYRHGRPAFEVCDYAGVDLRRDWIYDTLAECGDPDYTAWHDWTVTWTPPVAIHCPSGSVWLGDPSLAAPDGNRDELARLDFPRPGWLTVGAQRAAQSGEWLGLHLWWTAEVPDTVSAFEALPTPHAHPHGHAAGHAHGPHAHTH